MNTYEVRLACQVIGDDDSDPSAMAGAIAKQLRATGGHPEATVVKQEVAVDEGDVFQFTLRTDNESPVDAVLEGTSVIRAAAHAEGFFTQGWPQADEWHAYLKERSVEVVKVSAALASTETLVPVNCE